MKLFNNLVYCLWKRIYRLKYSLGYPRRVFQFIIHLKMGL